MAPTAHKDSADGLHNEAQAPTGSNVTQLPASPDANRPAPAAAGARPRLVFYRPSGAGTASDRRTPAPEGDPVIPPARRHRVYGGALRWWIDQAIVLGCLALAMLLGEGSWMLTATGGVAALIAFSLLGRGRQLYRAWPAGRVRAELLCVVETWLGVIGLSLLAVQLRMHSAGDASELLYWLLLTPIALCGWRLCMLYLLRTARARGIGARRLAVVGGGEFTRHLLSTIAGNPWIGLQVIGVFADGAEAGAPRPEGARSLDELVALARRGEVDVIYITLPADAQDKSVADLLERLSDSTISAYLVRDRRSSRRGSPQGLRGLLRLPWLHRWSVDIGGFEAVSVYESPFLGPNGWIKRGEDILVSVLALALLAVPMLIIAVGVKFSGPGPVLFKQRRYGLDGRPILVWKFRSMTTCDDGDHIVQARKVDPRVTRFGAFLRRTSLDELPQFFNVLQGTMSVVGPRPHAVAHNEYYRTLVGGYMLRHKVRPGITGWAQINGLRGETETPEKMRRRVEFDLEYIRDWSLWLDIRILFVTPARGLMHRNAY